DRLTDGNHPARNLLDNGKDLQIRVTRIDLSDAEAHARREGWLRSGQTEKKRNEALERAAKRILRVTEQLRLREVVGYHQVPGNKWGSTYNGVRNINSSWPYQEHLFQNRFDTYGDNRIGRRINVTRSMLGC